MDHRRWGFEEADDGEFDTDTADTGEPDDDHLLMGQDPAQVVTVSVTDAATVVAVELATAWRSSIDARVLHENVLAAVKAATARAIAKQAEQVDLSAAEADGTTTSSATSESSDDETPITKDYAMQLLSAVSSDLEQFMHRASAFTSQQVTAQSEGQHVSVSGMRQQVGEVIIDPAWASRARNSEIESELQEVLSSFMSQSSPGELAQGPQSPAINELMSLVSNPENMVRRINGSRPY